MSHLRRLESVTALPYLLAGMGRARRFPLPHLLVLNMQRPEDYLKTLGEENWSENTRHPLLIMSPSKRVFGTL